MVTDEDKLTSVSKIVAAGDMVRDQSLVVWAIADARHAARGADKLLRGEARDVCANAMGMDEW